MPLSMFNCGCYLNSGLMKSKMTESATIAVFTKTKDDKARPIKQTDVVENKGHSSGKVIWTTWRMVLVTMVLLLLLFIGIALCLIVYFAEAKLCKSGSTVAFSVSVKYNQNILKPNETIRFDEVTTNIGDGFNQPTSIFTVPVGGLYMLDVSLAARTREQIDFWIVRNGKRLKRVFLAGQGDNWVTTSTAVIRNMKADDKIWVKSNKYTGELVGNGLTSFSGFLINPPCDANY